MRRASLSVNSFSSMFEGLTTFTVMPFLASSRASERANATTAAFAAAYAEIFLTEGALRSHGAEIDDASPAPATHVREHGAAHVNDAREVRIEDGLPIREGTFRQRAPAKSADVVHENIDAAIAVRDGSH